ncbi:MAG: methyl-accepting chemotaxis protein [Candidatus Eisenbacteria bacterium]
MILGTLITVLGAVYLVTQSRRTIEKQALQSAESIAYQIGQDRTQYLTHINEDDLDQDLLHSIGMSVDGEGLYRVNLIGIWPVDSAHSPRDAFEVEAVGRILKDPKAVATRIHKVQGQPTLTYMRAENSTLQACVDCHEMEGPAKSATFGEPRFALHEPIGALVVEVPLGAALASAGTSSMKAVAVLVLIMGGAIFGLLRILSGTVERPVAGLLEAVAPLADGDFSRPVKVEAVGEVARIATAIETVRSRVAGVLQELSGTVATVQDAAGGLAGRAATLAEGSQHQAASLEETTASLRAMTETVRSNAEHAQEAKRIVAQTRDQAEAGGQAVQAAVQAMSGIAQASRRITDISTTIDEIAFQTNLLALNAAVEAARAGDQGRSFMVVANEVRALALRSGEASKEIKSVITDTVTRVDEGNKLVGRAGVTLTGIVGEVKQVADLVVGIAGASTEQADGIEQVSRAVQQMDAVTQETASHTEEVDRTARSLAGQADELRSQIGRFKLDDTLVAHSN